MPLVAAPTPRIFMPLVLTVPEDCAGEFTVVPGLYFLIPGHFFTLILSITLSPFFRETLFHICVRFRANSTFLFSPASACLLSRINIVVQTFF